MMKRIFAVLLAVHGVIHFGVAANAFHYPDLLKLSPPISREMGMLWLAAGGLLVAAALLTFLWPRNWWIVGGFAVIASQAAIASASDPNWVAGTAVNLVILAAVSHAFLTNGPWSYRARFEQEIDPHLGQPIDARTVTDEQVGRLPAAVQRYLRSVGAANRPSVWNYRIRFRGRIRSSPGAPWMPFTAEQQSLTDPPARFFLMHARMMGVPIEAFHRFVDGHATMQVKIAGIYKLVDARGDVMDRSETVTLFNDMCLLAPATLIDPAITWEPVDANTVRAHFHAAAQTITATLSFASDGLLTNFVSDDRSRASADGKTFTGLRFSTPVRGYRPLARFVDSGRSTANSDNAVVRLAVYGDARWSLPEEDFTYAEFEVLSVEYNVPAQEGAHRAEVAAAPTASSAAL
jgi:hypothetical protein